MNAANLNSQLDHLKSVYMELNTLNHGIDMHGDNNYIPFAPTLFMYSYEFFNTIYNIDWEKSLQQGKIVDFPKNKKIDLKIEAFWKFFTHHKFNKKSYLLLHKEDFISQSFSPYSQGKIMAIFNEIKIKNNFGYSITPQQFKNQFLEAIKKIYKQDSVMSYKDWGYITQLITNTRNNIFHGAKSFTDLKEARQSVRLQLYSQILMTSCNMLFGLVNMLAEQEQYDEEEEEE